jgi:hypothetical protein
VTPGLLSRVITSGPAALVTYRISASRRRNFMAQSASAGREVLARLLCLLLRDIEAAVQDIDADVLIGRGGISVR